MVEDLTEILIEIARFVAKSAWGVLPVFLLSVSLGVLVRALKLDGAIRRAFSRRVALSIVLATAVGAFSPFCSCTVIPLVAGLLIGGVPLAPVMAFWVASPTMDPEIFALSVGLLGWPLAVARLLATLALSLGAGYLTLALTRSSFLRGPVLRGKVEERRRAQDETRAKLSIARADTTIFAGIGVKPTMRTKPVNAAVAEPAGGGSCSVTSAGPADGPREERRSRVVEGLRELSLSGVGRDVAKEGWRLGKWLLVAFALEAVILLYVPQETIAGLLGTSNSLAVPLAALVGLPLYLNEAGALPIVAGLVEGGMSPGAAIAFLISGPATTVPAMAAVWALVRARVFALYVGVALFGATGLGLLTDLVL